MTLKLRCKYLVVDSNAFINNTPIFLYGQNIYTISNVIEEIKDENTKRRLSILPYKLNIKNVDQENIKEVIAISKETGDFPALSTTDIKLIALSLKLLKNKPLILTEKNTKSFVKDINLEWKDTTVNDKCPGFYNPSDVNEENFNTLVYDMQNTFINPEEAKDSNFYNDGKPDDSTWITPYNISDLSNKIEPKEPQFDEPILCDLDEDLLHFKDNYLAILTDDFAMQNVCFKMGIPVRSSIDGKLIKTLRNYAIFCKSCYKTSRDMDKKFCFHCGNRSLTRVPFTLDSEGNMTLHFNPQKLHRRRGLKFSLPPPQGGKHPKNIVIIKEDQKFAQNISSKPRNLKKNRKNKILSYDDPSYSPFALNDVNSRAFNTLGLISRNNRKWIDQSSNIKKNKIC